MKSANVILIALAVIFGLTLTPSLARAEDCAGIHSLSFKVRYAALQKCDDQTVISSYMEKETDLDMLYWACQRSQSANAVRALMERVKPIVKGNPKAAKLMIHLERRLKKLAKTPEPPHPTPPVVSVSLSELVELKRYLASATDRIEELERRMSELQDKVYTSPVPAPPRSPATTRPKVRPSRPAKPAPAYEPETDPRKRAETLKSLDSMADSIDAEVHPGAGRARARYRFVKSGGLTAALVTNVTSDSDAASVGLGENDAVVSFNGIPVSSRRMIPELMSAIRGEHFLTLRVYRGGKGSPVDIRAR